MCQGGKMADIVDSGRRSRMMAGIRGKNTRPELALRHELHRLGFRYRLHSGILPGKPDMVFPRFKAVVFVHGCFWHRHASCKYATEPKTRPEFWLGKFEANTARDSLVRARLLDEGWRVAVVWECALRRKGAVREAASQVGLWLQSDIRELELGA